jgi:sulfur transfer complex TusBCD TusB component (DsrH family)
MASIVVTLISAPGTPGGRRALALAGSLAAQGHALTLCCLQDAVLLGSDRAPLEARMALERVLAQGGRCLVLRQDLAMRGLRPAAQAAVVDHAGIVATLAAGHDRVIGAV